MHSYPPPSQGKNLFRTSVIGLFLCSFLLALAPLAFAQDSVLFSEEEMLHLNHSEEEWRSELDRHRRGQATSTDGWVDELDPFNDELELPRQTKGSGNEAYSPTGTRRPFGPIVSIVDPQNGGEHFRSSVPVSLVVFLKSREAPIDIDSLIVKGKRGFFSLNITRKMRKYLRAPQHGENADYVIDAKIPKLKTGKYLITLSLADTRGNLEERSVFLEVIKH